MKGMKIMCCGMLLLLGVVTGVHAQKKNVDKIIAVVDKHILLLSEFEDMYREYLAQTPGGDTASLRARVFEEMLFQKLLVSQADRDSVSVKDEQVEAEMNRRMGHYINQFGSPEKLEAFYGKSIDMLKEELQDDVRDQLIAQQMQSKVNGDIKVSPAEVRQFYFGLPADSLPLISSEIEIGQMVKKPNVSIEAKKIARDKLEGIRQRVIAGESMITLATLYTEDPGSIKTGGRYDNVMRGQFMPEFEAVAFRLKPGEISEIFETMAGYHFVQLIARKGEMVDVRHILMIPKVSGSDIGKCRQKLDSIYTVLTETQIPFCEAVSRNSDEAETKNNCGLMTNPYTGNTKFEIEEIGQMDQNLVFMLDKLQVGEFTKPVQYQTQDGKQAYRILYLKSRSEPHRLSLQEDYQRVQNMCIASKQKKILSDWIGKKSKVCHIRIDPDFARLKLNHPWSIKNNG